MNFAVWTMLNLPLAKIPGKARPLAWLIVEETHEGLIAHWQYNDSLFAESTIRRLSDHFQNLLFSIVASPNESIGKLPLLSSQERLQILSKWNHTDADYPHDKCVHQLFEQQVSLDPNAIAVECLRHNDMRSMFNEQRFTYRQLNNKANQLAYYLREQGVGPDVLVGVCFRRSFDMIVALFAILKAGGAYVPLDAAYPMERLQFMLRDSGVSVLVSQKEILKEISLECNVVVCLDSDAETIASYSSENPVVNVKPDNLAYVIYTSGSTGTPKGTLIHHRGVVNYLSWCIKTYAVSDGSGAPVNSSIAFDATITSVFASLVAGKRILLLPEKDEIEALSAVLVSDNDFSLVKITPAHLDVLQHLLHLERLQNQVRAIVIGGEALNYRSIETWRKYASGTRLINEYGPTETVVGCCTYEVSGELPQSGDVPIGRPISNTQIYILDRYLQPVPIGVSGEIYVGGAGVAHGYLNRPELTTERFVVSPFDGNANVRLYRTGDLGRYLPNGDIVFMGRMDQQVKIRGYRIELAEIETALTKHPAVVQSTVIARNEHPEKKLVAYLVTRDSSLTSNHLRSHLAKILPQYMLPAYFVFLDKLPLTPNGKVDRKALPGPDDRNTRTGNIYVVPRDKIETQLVSIFQKALNIEKIGVTDDFFELGGSSIQAAEIFSKISRVTGKQLPLSTLIANPTIERLAVFIKAEDKATSCLVPIQTQGSKPPLFCVHGGWGNVLFYRHLAKHLGTNQPLYALQAMGLSGNEKPYDDLGEIAAHYIREMRSVQPNGPYFLAGYCFGAIAAFEMAQQVVSEGGKIAFLASFNGIAPRIAMRKAEVSQETTLTAAKTKRRSFRKIVKILKRYMMVKRYRFLKKMRSFSYTFIVKRGLPIPQALRRAYVVDALLEAQESYTPESYPGDLAIFRSPEIFKSPDLGWAQLISGRIKTYDIPGDHPNRTRIMYEPFVQFLAEAVKKQLEECTHK